MRDMNNHYNYILQLYNSERIIITTQSSIQSLTNQLTDTQLTINELRYTVSQLRMRETGIMADLELYKTDNGDKEMKLTECLNELNTMVSRCNTCTCIRDLM